MRKCRYLGLIASRLILAHLWMQNTTCKIICAEYDKENTFYFNFDPFPHVFFQFPSRSRTSGMELSIPVPVPELPNVIPAHPCLLLLLMLMLGNVLTKVWCRLGN